MREPFLEAASPESNQIPPDFGTARQLDACYRSLLRDAGLAPATIRQVHAVIRRALAQAVKWGWLRANPAVDASPPRLRRQEVAPPVPPILRSS